ncbi:MAG: replication protein A [Methanobrevibacter sp.]|uniref:OB-fold nucleic acid binding domain-containing protein n=1 Tax=Methanobrevibacter sp. TaxID=66852 RepID=UPI0025F5BD44|nr:OB-fold nucleic acid binding domain-containing protein [Methanobrevibacter sp.]MBQ6138654.1 replication protein A [Methanobrevibacter sp.]
MDKEFFNGMNLVEDISEEDFQYIMEGWEKVQDSISKDEFIDKFNKVKDEYKDASFFSDKDFIDMVVNPFTGKETKDEEHYDGFDVETPKTIAEVDSGRQGFSVIARVMSISNPKKFTTRKGDEGELANMQIADNTGEVRLVLWSENIKHLRHITEGDIVEISDIDCKDGFRGGKEFSLRPRSLLKAIDETNENYPKNIDEFPVYEENIIPISDIVPDQKVSIIGRLIRVPTPHSYESNGKKGKVTSLEIQDNTGIISYTLWNKDVNLIESLDLKEGDVVKILNEQSRKRNDEISLSHWDGRILKVEGDYDLPEYEENIVKIADAVENKNASLIGVVTKIQDTITFKRQDGTDGFVKSIEISDASGSIRVTLWGDDTKLKVSKGDVLKVIGGDVEYDDYSRGHRVNTNWNTELKVNPDLDEDLVEELNEIASNLGPIAIRDVQEHEDDGEEVDIIGRLITIYDSHSFQRDDGSTGFVRSGDIADSTGKVRISFWDEKAEASYGIGKAYQIENARTRLGMYEVELNVGKTTRVIELTDAESSDLPSFEDLEEQIYETKKIDDLDDDDMNVKVVARIMEIEDTREFERQDGSKGLVRNMTIGDDSGFIAVTLWDDKTNLPYDINDAIKIQNPRINYNDMSNRVELSVGNSTNMLQPSYNELSALPDIEDLRKELYTSKTIETLELEDRNVRVTGTFSEPFVERILIPKCPICNRTIEDEDEELCPHCGNEIDKPKYLLMLPGKLSDDTGEIQVTFFNELVEQLLDMKHDDIVALYEENEGDLGFLETRVMDLEGRTLEVIADVNYNNYDEEIRLRPKRIDKIEF